MNIYKEQAERLLRRVDMCWTRFEQSGDPMWADAAVAADRMYLRAREAAR